MKKGKSLDVSRRRLLSVRSLPSSMNGLVDHHKCREITDGPTPVRTNGHTNGYYNKDKGLLSHVPNGTPSLPQKQVVG